MDFWQGQLSKDVTQAFYAIRGANIGYERPSPGQVLARNVIWSDGGNVSRTHDDDQLPLIGQLLRLFSGDWFVPAAWLCEIRTYLIGS